MHGGRKGLGPTMVTRFRNFFLLILSLLLPLIPIGSLANSGLAPFSTKYQAPAPDTLQLEQYLAWAEPILTANPDSEAISPYSEQLFQWYQRNKGVSLPSELSDGREPVFINVERPLAEVKAMELKVGKVPGLSLAETVGAEVYARMNGSARQVLDAVMFRWGKPVGNGMEGCTRPADAFYSDRQDCLRSVPAWGTGAYVSDSLRLKSSLLPDLADRFLVLLREVDGGYDILIQFIQPIPERSTPTKRSLTFIIIRPIDEKTASMKMNFRYQGTSYRGFPMGYQMFGFNRDRSLEVFKKFDEKLAEIVSKQL